MTSPITASRATQGRVTIAMAFFALAGLLGACGDDDSSDTSNEDGGGGLRAGSGGSRPGGSGGARAGGSSGRSSQGGAAGEAGAAGNSNLEGGAGGWDSVGAGGAYNAGAPQGGALTGGAGDAGAMGGEAGAGGSGGAAEEAPQWLAYAVRGALATPLYALSTADDVEPVMIAPNIFDSSPPEWRVDGTQLLFVEYVCCGSSNGAYTVDVSPDGMGEPALIHEPLSGGASVTRALYAAGGDVLVALLRDASYTGHWAFRQASAETTDWTPITPGQASANMGSVSKAPDDSAVVLIERNTPDPGQRVYLVDFEATATPTGVLVHETTWSGAEIYDVTWSPSSASFVLSGELAPLWVSRDEPTQALPLSSSEQFYPYASITFSPDSTGVLFSAADSTDEASASQGVFVRSISGSGPGALATVLPPPSGHLGYVGLAGWLDNDRIVISADARTDDMAELFLGDRAGNAPASLLNMAPPGASIPWFQITDSEIVFSATDALGSFQNLYRIDSAAGVEGEPTALTEFAVGSSRFAVPLSVRENDLVFTTYAMNPDTGAYSESRLFYLALGAEGSEPVDLLAELPAGADAQGVAWSSDGRFLAYTGDLDANAFADLGVLEFVDGTPEQARDVVNILDGDGAQPALLTWQPQ